MIILQIKLGVAIPTDVLLPVTAVCCCHLVVLPVTAKKSCLLHDGRIPSMTLLWEERIMNWSVDYKLQMFLQELVTVDGRAADSGSRYKQKRLELNCILATRQTARVPYHNNFSCKFNVNVGKPVRL
jgi:hypothetical protein